MTQLLMISKTFIQVFKENSLFLRFTATINGSGREMVPLSHLLAKLTLKPRNLTGLN